MLEEKKEMLLENCSIETLEALNKALSEAIDEMQGERSFIKAMMADPMFDKMVVLNTIVFKLIAKKTLNSMK